MWVLVLVLVAALPACTLAPAVGERLDTPEELAAWIAEHPANAALVVDGPFGRIEQGPVGERFVLASTAKVLILATYADRVASGTLDPDEQVRVGTVERWYWPGTDGGAHRRALEDLRRRNRTIGSGEAETLSLDDVAWSMIRWSDNAATDHVLGAIGGPSAVAEVADRLGMRHQDPLVHTFGMFVAWSKVGAIELQAESPADRSRRSLELAERTSVDRAGGTGLDSQRELAKTFPGGTAREWADLLAELAEGAVLGPEATAVVRRHLQWPMTIPGNDARFTVFATKGGSLPGVLTEASTIQPVGRGQTTAVLFFRDLPSDVERSLKRSYVHQELLVRLAEDPAFFREVQRS